MMKDRETRAKAAEIFRRAAQYIRSHGWREKGMARDGQPRCSMGALASAYPKHRWEPELSSLMYEALRQELQDISLTQYNHQMQDGEKVARLYEKVANNLQK